MGGKKRVEGSNLPSLLDRLEVEDAESKAFLDAEDFARVAAVFGIEKSSSKQVPSIDGMKTENLPYVSIRNPGH